MEGMKGKKLHGEKIRNKSNYFITELNHEIAHPITEIMNRSHYNSCVWETVTFLLEINVYKNFFTINIFLFLLF